MKISFNEALLDFGGKPMIKEDTGEPLTIKNVCINSLIGTSPKRDIKPEDKFKQAVLAEKIYNNDELDLSVDNIKLLKDLVGMFWSPIVVMQVWRKLDPPSEDN